MGLLGEQVPTDRARRQQWAELVEQVHAYRTEHQITDPERAFGPPAPATPRRSRRPSSVDCLRVVGRSQQPAAVADLGRAAEQATGSAAAAAERQRLEQAAADFRQAAEQRRSWLGRHRASAGLDRTPARVDQHARDRVRDLDRAG